MADDRFDGYCYLSHSCSQQDILGVGAKNQWYMVDIYSEPSRTTHRELHASRGSEGRTFRYDNVTVTEELDVLLCQLKNSNW